MPRQRFTPEQIIGKLREVEVAIAKGSTVSAACQGVGAAGGSQGAEEAAQEAKAVAE